MKKNSLVCPVCGSDSLNKIKKNYKVSEPFASEKEIEIEIYKCKTCGSEGDFRNQNDLVITKILDAAKIESIKNILTMFIQNKISMSAIERALDLPQRTLTKWKNGVTKPSASGIALLRMLRTFPWLLEVAENNYDSNTSQKIYLLNAVKCLLDRIAPFENDYSEEFGIISSPQSVLMYMYSGKPDQDTEREVNAFQDRAISGESNQAIFTIKG